MSIKTIPLGDYLVVERKEQESLIVVPDRSHNASDFGFDVIVRALGPTAEAMLPGVEIGDKVVCNATVKRSVACDEDEHYLVHCRDIWAIRKEVIDA